jgi:hypothetical protein
MRRGARGPLLALALVAPEWAHAGRPMIADDARVATAKGCQVESWIRGTDDATEAWTVPACNPGGNLELAFGGARTREGGDSRFTENVLQAKTLFRPVTDAQWGLGLTVGTVRHPARATANGWPGDSYVNVPLSVPVLGDAWIAHLNAGAVRRRDSGRDLGTWAFANEVRVNGSLFVIPEIFRADFGRPFVQAGLRYEVVRDRVQVSAAIGDRIHGGERWFSLGVSLFSPPFLP